jgi:hypothetical protein
VPLEAADVDERRVHRVVVSRDDRAPFESQHALDELA